MTALSEQEDRGRRWGRKDAFLLVARHLEELCNTSKTERGLSRAIANYIKDLKKSAT